MRSSTTEQTVDTLFLAFQQSFKDNIVIHKFAKTIPTFVRDCIRACWLMNLHEPALVALNNIAHGTDFDSNKYEIYTKEGNTVYYMVWPAILLHEGGPVLAKGVVECIPSHKRSTPSRQTKQ
ncbi:hypothetical protein DPMN_113308 [Dreissena polymorpha]|uniref:Mitochondria-eating protein C-terminal domain-containing protein n=1 Tax=Dreissena polymorpha TaxID=45954 RepID=A0A9D4KH88_DREPO|nr:hypothetical protein DPMN_113308 [Dreissena polymorpha]